jgi:hypothetical protein
MRNYSALEKSEAKMAEIDVQSYEGRKQYLQHSQLITVSSNGP